MYLPKKLTYIDEADISSSSVLIRIDMDVTLDEEGEVVDDMRIRYALPTIEQVLSSGNTPVLLGHMGRPKGRDDFYSTSKIVPILEKYFPDINIRHISGFSAAGNIKNNGDIYVFENTRFWKEEKANDPDFCKKLASLGDIYVNNAFATCHRKHASTYGIAEFLPSYAGLILRDEVQNISKASEDNSDISVAIMGGSKLETKLQLVESLLDTMEYVLIGGVLANTFFAAMDYEIGESKYDKNELNLARKILFHAAQKKATLLLPSDVTTSDASIKNLQDISKNDSILDIGIATMARYGSILARADNIIWNGPLGYIENETYKKGSDFIYHSIANNKNALSVVGGGDTNIILSDKGDSDNITHISTGGGAMLDLIANGELPGIEILKS